MKMEQEAKNNEKKALFEDLKVKLTKQGKKNNMMFLLWCLILAAGLVAITISHYDLVGQLLYTVLFAVLVVSTIHSSHWYGKMTKAATVQEMLSIFDKNRKIEKWKVYIIVPISVILALIYLFKGIEFLPVSMLFIGVAANYFRSIIEEMSDDIEYLRDPEPQED